MTTPANDLLARIAALDVQIAAARDEARALTHDLERDLAQAHAQADRKGLEDAHRRIDQA